MYSYDDTRELAPDVDALTHARGIVDSFGRDVDDFARDVCADSLSEYLDSLAHAVDARELASHERSSARACTRAQEMQRALFDDAVTRYLRTHVNGAHVGTQRELLARLVNR